MFKKSAAPAVGGYTLTKSLRFRSSASAYLNRTPGSASNRKTWTWSGWIKFGNFSSSTTIFSCGNTGTNPSTGIQFVGGTNELQVYDYTTGYNFNLTTSQVFRDPAAWYHIVVALDTTQATASNRLKLYVNGAQITALSTTTYPTQNTDYQVNNTVPHNIGKFSQSSAVYLDGYLAEVNFIDGQQLDPTSFGSFSGTGGVWQPKQYTGTYGTNGFYLKFTDTTSTTTLCYDYSGNSNNWTPNNISLTAGATYDSTTDVPTLTSATTANYGTINPLMSGGTISNANTKAVLNNQTAFGTLSTSTGKLYFECKVDSAGTDMWFGVLDAAINLSSYNSASWSGGSGLNYKQDGNKNNGSNTAYGATWTTGDVLGCALDMTGGTITFYKNGVSQGVAFSSNVSGRTFTPYFYAFTTATATLNFGQIPFAYSIPSGYTAWNVYNTTSPTISQPNLYMDATIFTANGTTQTVTNAASLKPDFIWTKNRSIAQNHYSVDTNQGISQVLRENSSAAATTDANFFTSITSNGFTLGSSNFGNGENIVAWQWQAGQGTTSSNTTGSITSNVSVSTTGGFSIVTYTGNGTNGASVGHGLGVTPAMVIIKQRNATNSWVVYHQSISSPSSNFLILEGTSATQSAPNFLTPSSTLLTFTTSYGGTNGNTNTYVAYCWASIAGFSNFGTYAGNGQSDGPFVFTGFRPKFVLIKCTTTSVDDWTILDSTRNPYNVANSILFPNTNGAEATSAVDDYLSNGFKLRQTGNGVNGSGQTYIYAAYAENPFKYALAR